MQEMLWKGDSRWRNTRLKVDEEGKYFDLCGLVVVVIACIFTGLGVNPVTHWDILNTATTSECILMLAFMIASWCLLVPLNPNHMNLVGGIHNSRSWPYFLVARLSE